MKEIFGLRRMLSAGVIVAAVTLAAFAVTGCVGTRPGEQAAVERAVIPAGNAILESTLETPVMTTDRLRLLAVELRSDRELLLYYAGNNDFDRDTAQVRGVREVWRIDPQTGVRSRLDPEDAPWTPRYRDFTDRTPAETSWFGGALVIDPKEHERRYTVVIEGPKGAPPLPMALRASYGRGPDRLRVTFFVPVEAGAAAGAGGDTPTGAAVADGSGQGDRYRRLSFTYRLSALDISGGVTAELLRTLSAIRWDGVRYVTFLDSIFDLETGRQLRLINHVPTGFVEVITVDPAWGHTAIMFGALRISKQTGVAAILLDGDKNLDGE